MQRRIRLAVAAAVALAAGGCATTMTVSSHVERGLDVTAYRSYDWGPADALPTGDPRLDRNPFFKDHMEGAVDTGLFAKGLVRSPSGATPDLLVHYHASVTERLDVDRRDRQYGYCEGEPCRGSLIAFEAGTLVLDVVDTRTNRVIWRGWAQERLDNLLDDPDKMERSINQAISRMLERLPIHGPGASRPAVAQAEDRP